MVFAGATGTATSLFVSAKSFPGGGGNANIGRQLYQLLVDHNQEIPEWFATEYGHGNGRRGASRYATPLFFYVDIFSLSLSL